MEIRWPESFALDENARARVEERLRTLGQSVDGVQRVTILCRPDPTSNGGIEVRIEAVIRRKQFVAVRRRADVEPTMDEAIEAFASCLRLASHEEVAPAAELTPAAEDETPRERKWPWGQNAIEMPRRVLAAAARLPSWERPSARGPRRPIGAPGEGGRLWLRRRSRGEQADRDPIVLPPVIPSYVPEEVVPSPPPLPPIETRMPEPRESFAPVEVGDPIETSEQVELADAVEMAEPVASALFEMPIEPVLDEPGALEPPSAETRAREMLQFYDTLEPAPAELERVEETPRLRTLETPFVPVGLPVFAPFESRDTIVLAELTPEPMVNTPAYVERSAAAAFAERDALESSAEDEPEDVEADELEERVESSTPSAVRSGRLVTGSAIAGAAALVYLVSSPLFTMRTPSRFYAVALPPAYTAVAQAPAFSAVARPRLALEEPAAYTAWARPPAAKRPESLPAVSANRGVERMAYTAWAKPRPKGLSVRRVRVGNEERSRR